MTALTYVIGWTAQFVVWPWAVWLDRRRRRLEAVSWSFDDLPSFDQYRSAVDP